MTMRIAPGFVIVLMIFADTVLFPSGSAISGLCPAILSGACLLLMYPLSYEDGRYSFVFACLSAVLLLLTRVSAGLFGLPSGIMALPLLAAPALYWVQRVYGRYRNVRSLCRLDGIWCKVEDDALAFYNKAYMTLLVLYLLADPLGLRHIADILVSLCAGVLFVLLYIRAYAGTTCFIGRQKESEVRRMSAEWESHNEMDPGTALQLERIYRKVERYMNDRKPFLEFNFSLDNLADAMFCNKVYLSRAINLHSGRNFRQYVNRYRVQYAAQMMDSDPHARVMEVASRAGFHSMVTFSMAFKLNMNVTPGEYRSGLQVRRLQ